MIGFPDASVMGMPIEGFGAIEAVTTEQDWVVTGSRGGQPFRLYVSPSVTREQAIMAAASALNLMPANLEWISASRRNQVERCIRLDSDWLRSRTV